jgi:magnesium chelatase accessory protein
MFESFYPPMPWEQWKSQWPFAQHSMFVNAAGLRWHVQSFGDGPLLLMLHGLGASTHSWRGLAPLLAPHFRVVMIDLPGHAFTSTPTAQAAGLQAMAQALHDLLLAQNLWPQVVVGHSAGATLAARMLLNHPEHPAPDLVAFNPAWLPLSGAAHWLFPLSAKLISLNPLSAWLFAKTMQQDKFVSKILNSTGSTVREGDAFFYKALMQSPSHVQGVLQMMLHQDLGALPAQLAELKSRVLVVAGMNDKAVPHDRAVSAQQRIPDATLLSLQDLGHLAHEENPGLCAKEVLQWLQDST